MWKFVLPLGLLVCSFAVIAPAAQAQPAWPADWGSEQDGGPSDAGVMADPEAGVVSHGDDEATLDDEAEPGAQAAVPAEPAPAEPALPAVREAQQVDTQPALPAPVGTTDRADLWLKLGAGLLGAAIVTSVALWVTQDGGPVPPAVLAGGLLGGTTLLSVGVAQRNRAVAAREDSPDVKTGHTGLPDGVELRLKLTY